MRATERRRISGDDRFDHATDRIRVRVDVRSIRFQKRTPDRCVAAGETKKCSQAAAREPLINVALFENRGQCRREDLRKMTGQRDRCIVFDRRNDLGARLAIADHSIDDSVFTIDEPYFSSKQIRTSGA